MIDDYAHHPTEIAATFDAIRAGWPGRRMVVIYQPHRYTRLRDLFEDFCYVLSQADCLLMFEVYPAGEDPVAGSDSRSLCRAIRMRGQVDPVFVEDKNSIYGVLSNVIEDHDLVLTLGAGDIGSVSRGIYQHYSRAIN